MSLADFEPAESFGGATDPECEVCGKPLSYSGKGRPPKFCAEHKGGKGKPSSGSAPRSSGSVESALGILDMAYSGIGTGLLMVQAPNAAAYFSQNVSQAQERNRQALEADPSLARMVNRFGEKSGKGIFLMAQLSLLAPTMMLAMQDRRERAALRDLENEVDQANAAPPPQRPQAAPQPPPQPAPAPQPRPQASAPVQPQTQPQTHAPVVGTNPIADAVREAREGRR